MGVRISRTSALVTSETGTLPILGKAWISRLRCQFLGTDRAAPPGPLLLDHAPGGLGERGDAHGAPLLGHRVAARAGELAVGQRLLARLGQRDQLATLPSPNSRLRPRIDEPLNPAPRSGPLHIEVEPVAVAVSAGRGRAHEGGREPLVGMTALGLASPALGGRS